MVEGTVVGSLEVSGAIAALGIACDVWVDCAAAELQHNRRW
jgi:hypothetical protein